MTLPALGQGLTQPSGFTAVDESSLAVPPSVQFEGVVDTEDMGSAQPTTTEAGAPVGLLTVGLLTENEAAVFEVGQTQPQAGQLHGRLEKSSGTRIEGWAWDPLAPDKRLRLELVEGGNQLLVVVADIYRADLVQLGCGDGRHGFRIELEVGLLTEGSHLLTLRCADTGATMPGSPIVSERRVPPATSYPPLATGDTGLIIRGQIDRVTDTAILGWVMMPERPLHKCTVLLKEGEHTLAQTIASQFRMDLLSAGVGDGCYSFALEPPWPLANGREHILDIVEEETGAKLNKEPLRWFPKLDAGRTGGARPSGAPDNRLSSATRRFGAVGRLQRAISRSDYARHRQMERFATAGVTARVLSVADSVRETGTIASRFLTDSMIAAWLLREDLQQRFQQLDEETCQYGLLVWFLCVRPIEEGLVLSREPTGPILTAMSNVIVAEEPGLGTACTALMVAAYCYVASYLGSTVLAPLQSQAKDIVAWFVCEGAYHLRVSHAIPQKVRADLAAPRSNGVSDVLEWAAHRMPALSLADLAEQNGFRGNPARLGAGDHDPAASCWRDLLRESLIVDHRARFDDPPNSVLPAVCGRLRDVVPEMAELLLVDGEPEYMCADGNGERLLLKGEWYPVEPRFVWSRAPISTVLFCISGGPLEWLRIGLMFDQSPIPERGMRVILNYNTLWSGTIGNASSGELILACTRRCLAADAPNLLQIEVDKAFVPSEQMETSDHRRLGIGLKRLWIQQSEGLSER